MSITLHISDSVASSLRIPEGEAEPRLRQELAVALYARGLKWSWFSGQKKGVS